MSLPSLPTRPLLEAFRWCLAAAQAPVLRTITDWAEAEILLPNGPFAGERYRHDRHPVSRLWFQAIDSGQWTRYAAAGPTQNGKTLLCYVMPVLYHLFEIGETVIIGLPDMAMAQDKWKEDFLPVIDASRYRELLPTTGEGSRGGDVKRAIKFRNGASLRFMSGGGGDKKRAGYTARVLAVTEVDGLDEAGEASREADKIEQLEGRTRAFGRTGKRIYLECTVSVEKGRIWQEIKQGTDSRIARPCPHCQEFVTPEREHLRGWKDVESEEEAAAKSAFHCPSCSEPWTEDQRREAAARAVLVHRGQEIDTQGRITGDSPATQTLGFRWSAIDNPFVSAGDLGAEEWLAAKSRDRDNAEKKMRQFVWTLPYEPPEIDLTRLEADHVAGRRGELRRGVVPADSIGIAVGVDTGKRELHWHAVAVRPTGNWPVIEYGTQTVEWESLGTTRGLLAALHQLRTYFDSGWPVADGSPRRTASQVWIDSGYHEHTNAVYQFCGIANKELPAGSERYRPSKGFGEGQHRTGRYVSPTRRTGDVVYVGNEYDIRRVRRNGQLLPGVLLVHISVDSWKSQVHDRLSMPADEPGALTLWAAADPGEHDEYSAHITAERKVEKFLPGRGRVIVWERIDRNNHFLDAATSSVAAADFVLQLRVQAEQKPAPRSWFGRQNQKRR
jgi:phage terminase large subunit GpA-like protein